MHFVRQVLHLLVGVGFQVMMIIIISMKMMMLLWVVRERVEVMVVEMRVKWSINTSAIERQL